MHCYMYRVGQNRVYTHCYMCKVGQNIRTATCVGLARSVYIYTDYNRLLGDFPAKNNNVYTACILHNSGQPQTCGMPAYRHIYRVRLPEVHHPTTYDIWLSASPSFYAMHGYQKIHQSLCTATSRSMSLPCMATAVPSWILSFRKAFIAAFLFAPFLPLLLFSALLPS